MLVYGRNKRPITKNVTEVVEIVETENAKVKNAFVTLSEVSSNVLDMDAINKLIDIAYVDLQVDSVNATEKTEKETEEVQEVQEVQKRRPGRPKKKV